MVATVHFIDKSWIVKSVVVGFIRVMYPHTGKLAEHLIQTIGDFDSPLLASVWAIIRPTTQP